LQVTKKLQDNYREQWKGKEKLTHRTDSIDGHFSKSLQIERQNAELITTPKTIVQIQQNPSQTEVDLSNQILSSEKYLKL
jgi:hypothetical protein